MPKLVVETTTSILDSALKFTYLEHTIQSDFDISVKGTWICFANLETNQIKTCVTKSFWIVYVFSCSNITV